MERPILAVLAAAPLVFVVACSAGASDDASTGGQGGDAPAGATGATGATGSGFGAGQGGSTVDPGEECLKDTFGATAAPANLLFQIDVSGSMNCAPLDTGCGVASPSPGSRWEVFQAQLVAALDTLPSTSGVGLMHYPTGTGTFQGQPTGCVPQTPDVPLGDLAAAKPSITSALDAIVPAGGTPTHDAITAALAQLSATTREGSKFLVLATDGQATFCSGCDLFCTSDELAADTDVLVQKVAAAAASGVRTFVLGAPGSNGFRGALSRLATAGQTPSAPGCSDAGPVYCHYDMTTSPDFGQALAAALAAIGGEALGCVYDIPPNPDGEFDPTLVNVQFTVDGQSSSIPKDTSHAAGWDYSPDGTQIILYGEACDEVKSAGTSATVDILYGCPTIVK